MAETSLDPNSEARKLLLNYFGQNEMMTDCYLRVYGTKIDNKAIQDIKRQVLAVGFKPDMVAQIAAHKDDVAIPQKMRATESAVYTIEIGCPCCRQKGIKHQELRAASLAVKYDAFLAPVYFQSGKYEALNYLTCAVAVCPRCLFASPDKGDFVQFNLTKRQFVQSQVSPGVLSELHDSWPQRKELQESLVPGQIDFFACPRPFPVAMLAYKLADFRAMIEAESKVPFAIFKRANYWVRLSLLARQSGEDGMPELEQALEFYKNAFYLTDFPSSAAEFQACFVLFSIYLRMGKLKEARDYIGVLELSKKNIADRKDPNAARILDHWLESAKRRWEDKENPNLWDMPK